MGKLGLGLGVGLSGRGGASGCSFELESRALFAAMTTPPSAARKAAIDTLIKALKASGDWSELDVFWMLAAADSQAARLNWKDPSFSALVGVNSPTFTADKGFKGDGSSSRLTFAYDANSFAGAKLTPNLAAAGIYILQAPSTGGGIVLSHGNTRLATNGPLTAIQYRVNDGTSGNITAMIGGHYMAKRTAANARLAFRNGVQTTSDSAAVVGVGTVTGNGGLLAFGASAFSNAELSVAYMGGNINPVAVDVAILTYLQSVGAV